MNERTQELLWIGAFRYYLGRRTYAVGMFCFALITAWDDLPERGRVVIARELREAIRRDNERREQAATMREKEPWFPLGMDCDREDWLRVRDRIGEHA